MNIDAVSLDITQEVIYKYLSKNGATLRQY